MSLQNCAVFSDLLSPFLNVWHCEILHDDLCKPFHCNKNYKLECWEYFHCNGTMFIWPAEVASCN
jgi:hypothetical protein